LRDLLRRASPAAHLQSKAIDPGLIFAAESRKSLFVSSGDLVQKVAIAAEGIVHRLRWTLLNGCSLVIQANAREGSKSLRILRPGSRAAWRTAPRSSQRRGSDRIRLLRRLMRRRVRKRSSRAIHDFLVFSAVPRCPEACANLGVKYRGRPRK